MANELTLTGSLAFTKGSTAISKTTFSKGVNVTGTELICATKAVPTSETTLSVGAVTPLAGYAIFENCDATNYVEIGNATGQYQIRLNAGEFAILRLDTWSAIYVKAHTAAVELQYWIFED